MSNALKYDSSKRAEDKLKKKKKKKEEEEKKSQNSISHPNWGKVDFFQASFKNPIFTPLLPTKSASEERAHFKMCSF